MVAIALLLACLGVASAQSTDIVIITDIPDRTPDADDDASVSPDAGSVVDAGASDVGHRIQIDRLGYELPEPAIVAAPQNDRAAIAEQVIAHVKYCIGQRSVSPSDADVGFLYLVRANLPNATLTTVKNDEGIHLSKFHVDVLRSVGETRAIDVRDQQKIFRECIAVVPLAQRPVVTERLSFRVKAGALKLLVRDVEWRPL